MEIYMREQEKTVLQATGVVCALLFFLPWGYLYLRDIFWDNPQIVRQISRTTWSGQLSERQSGIKAMGPFYQENLTFSSQGEVHGSEKGSWKAWGILGKVPHYLWLSDQAGNQITLRQEGSSYVGYVMRPGRRTPNRVNLKLIQD